MTQEQPNLATLIDTARRRLHALESKGRGSGDSLLYTGDWRDMIPRAMVRSPSVDCFSFRVYATLLSYASPDSPGVFPRIESLQSIVGVSRPTIIEALYKLRLLGWITAVPRERNCQGRYIGSIYLVHAQPVQFAVSVRLDPEYANLIIRCSSHRNRSLRSVAGEILAQLRRDVDHGIAIDAPPSALELLATQVALNRSMSALGGVTDAMDSISKLTVQIAVDEDGLYPRPSQAAKGVRTSQLATENNRIWLANLVGSVVQVNQVYLDGSRQVNDVYLDISSTTFTDPSKPGLPGESEKRAINQCVDNENHDSYNQVVLNTTTTPLPPKLRKSGGSQFQHDELDNMLVWPAVLHADERRIVSRNLAPLPIEQQQEVLDEFAGVAARGVVKNPVHYLRGLCRRVIAGEFSVSSAGLDVRRARERELQMRQAMERSEQASLEQMRASASFVSDSPLVERVAKLGQIAQTKKQDRVP